MKKISQISIVALGFFLCGCASLTDIISQTSEEEMIKQQQIEPVIQLQGIVKQYSNTFFSSKFLLFDAEDNELALIDTAELNIDIDDLIGKKVVIQGMWNKENHENFSQLILSAIDITKKEYEQRKYKSKFDVQFPISENVKVDTHEYKEIYNKNEKWWFTMIEQVDQNEIDKFYSEGTNISIGEENIWRLQPSDHEISFYFPSFNIQIDYVGKESDLPIFYALLENMSELESEDQINISNTNTINNPQDAVKENTLPDLEAYVTQTITPIMSLQLLVENIDEIVTNQEIKSEHKAHQIISVSFWNDFIDIVYVQNPLEDSPYSLQRILLYKKDNIPLQGPFQIIASFEENEKSMWKLTKGNIPEEIDQDPFFMNDIDQEKIQKLDSDFNRYLFPEYMFSVEYPKQWSTNSVINNASSEESETIEQETKKETKKILSWHNSDILNEKTQIATLSFQDGKIDMPVEDFTFLQVSVPYNETSHIVFKTNDQQKFALLQKMAYSLTIYL